MTRYDSPYYLPGPFAAATAVIAWAAMRLLGRYERPEYKASLIANLMSAGISAQLASEVSQIPDSLALTSMPRVMAYVDNLDVVKLRCVSLLEQALQQDQLKAFELGYDLAMAADLCLANWEEPSEGVKFVQNRVQSVYECAKSLGMDPKELFPFVQAANQCSTLGNLVALDPFFQSAMKQVARFLWDACDPNADLKRKLTADR
jgi:hypothetical protein